MITDEQLKEWRQESVGLSVGYMETWFQRINYLINEVIRLRQENAKLTKEVEVWEENYDEYGGGQETS